MKIGMLLVTAAALCAARVDAMTLASPDVGNGTTLSIEQVHPRCGGRNVSPALTWSGAPPATASFAVTLFDPDAHGGWWHWLVFDIPPQTHELVANAGSGAGMVAGAVQGTNDFGTAAYGGACPPTGSGRHHYEFTLWALDSRHAPFAATVKGSELAPYLKAHAIADAKLVGMYQG